MAARSSRSLTAAPMPVAVHFPVGRPPRGAFLRAAAGLAQDLAAGLVSAILTLAIVVAVAATVGALS